MPKKAPVKTQQLSPNGDILIYQNEKGTCKVDAFFTNHEIWLSQSNLAKLYQITSQNITMHINNIYKDKELIESATCKEFLQVQNEGMRKVSRKIKHYNLTMVFAIGYRVRSHIGMHFRNWATSMLTEYVQKGFALNDDRLKNPKAFGEDFFDELLERIRDIRSSEKRLYLKVADIYATSIDYAPNEESTKLFFQTVQNKMHYSVHGHTASEIIAERANANNNNMGLTSFNGAVVRKKDVGIAKNYLNQDELLALNRIVNMYLEFAEDRARQHIPMYMSDWKEKLNDFLKFTGREILSHAGTISALMAKEIANNEFTKFDAHRKLQAIELDNVLNEEFDSELNTLVQNAKGIEQDKQ